MKSILLAMAGLVAASVPVEAVDLPPDASTTSSIPLRGSVEGAWEKVGDSDWHKIKVKAGIGYAVAGGTADNLSGTLVLRDAKGKELQRSGMYSFFQNGFSFVPKVSGAFYVETIANPTSNSGVKYPQGYSVDFLTDCPAGLKTNCTIKPGETQKWASAYTEDVDWIKTTLKAGQRVTIYIETEVSIVAKMYDQNGKFISDLLYKSDYSNCGEACFTKFRAPRAGNYFISVVPNVDEIPGYTLRLTSP